MTYPFCLLSFSFLIFKVFFFFFLFILRVIFFIFIWADQTRPVAVKRNEMIFTFVLCVCFSLISYFGPVLSKKNGIGIAFRFNVPCFSVPHNARDSPSFALLFQILRGSGRPICCPTKEK